MILNYLMHQRKAEPHAFSLPPAPYETWADYNAALGAEIALDPRNR